MPARACWPGCASIEIADERAEYCGLLLAGLGAEVIKIEPPEGNATRRIGPYLDDEPGLERSLFFWNYNRNKKSVVLDLQSSAGREHMLRLLGGADISARRELRRAQRSARSRPRRAQRAFPATRHRADDARLAMTGRGRTSRARTSSTSRSAGR